MRVNFVPILAIIACWIPSQRCVAADSPKAVAPDESLARIKVAEGFKIELVASEPLVADPVAFDWGADGSLWVAEMGDYPNGATWNKKGDPLGEPGGRIKHLFDDDGDGTYDRATLFLDKVAFPSGIKAWRNGVLVTAAPEIFYAEDTNGDGVADKRETLYKGFTEGNQQHRVNGLRWGLDNWLYLANGDSGGTIKSIKTGESVDIRGRDVRIRPDTGEIEAISGQTQFGRNRDDWGNWFGGNNSNPMWHYALEDHYLKRNPHYAAPNGKQHVSNVPGASPIFPASRTLTRFNDFDKVDRFTSACSPIVYRDELLFGESDQRSAVSDQQEFVSQVFICEPVHNLVHREIMRASGSTFASRRADDERASEFLASSDNWFRPTMVRTGPDGALWVSDMYRLVIEHPEWIPMSWQEKLDLRAGHDMGRIYRVVPTNGSGRDMTRLDQLDTPALVQSLDSPNGWQRDMAHQMLLWRNDAEAVDALKRLAANAARPTTRLHALCTLDGMDKLTESLVAASLQDKHPGVRRYSVKFAERYLNESPSLSQSVLSLVDDDDAQVRIQVAYTLGQWSDSNSGTELIRLAMNNRDDRFIVAAALSGIRADSVANALKVVLPVADSHTELTEQLLSMAIVIGEPSVLQAALRSLLVERDGRFEPWQISTTTSILKALDRRSINRKKFFGDEGSNELRELLAHARRVASDRELSDNDRLSSITLLGAAAANEDDLRALAELLTPQNSSTIQTAAVTAMTTRGLSDAPGLLLDEWSTRLPSLRAQILDRLVSRTNWTQSLLDSIESNVVSANEIDARLRQQLQSHRDGAIRERAAKMFEMATTSTRSQVLADHAEVVMLAGSHERGQLVFTKRCATCHRLRGIGKHVGPDLTALTDKSPAAMLVAILDPNRAVEDKFRDYVALTIDGRQITGMITSETGTSITLTGADAKEQSILRTDLEELRSTGRSMMPEGMEKDLSHQDLADVMAFARSISAPPKQFPGNEPQVAPTRNDGSIRCFAIHARVYGPTLVFEEKLRNLGFWGSIEDHAIWSLEVPKAGTYRVSFEYACPESTAGNHWKIAVGQSELTGAVESTGSWDTYRSVTVGNIELPAGAAELVFRSDGKINGHLLDLRSIRLLPQGK